MNRPLVELNDPLLPASLVEVLSQGAITRSEIEWPRDSLASCAAHGLFSWFVSQEQGGAGWPDGALARAYVELSTACLTTAFVITQRQAACSRILASSNESLKTRWLPKLARGEAFATVAISHLTTSRRHIASPVLQAVESESGFELNGYSPWVTGAAFADVIVTGAVCADGRQVLFAVPRNTASLRISPPEKLVGLTASHTGRIDFNHAFLERELLMFGPDENVMQFGGSGTGGIVTSALAIGLSSAAIGFMKSEVQARPDLAPPVDALRAEWQTLFTDLLSIASGSPGCSNESLRSRANSLVLRSTQSALAAAKGTGYVDNHRAGRWCREALFFLVWSCPQPVVTANLCELAGLDA